MKRRILIAYVSAIACLATLPLGVTAQGKGAEKEKGPAKAAAQGEDKSNRGRDKDQSAKNSDNRGKNPEAKAAGKDISGGVRGVERRSDRANEVAAGPNPKSAKSHFLNAKEVKRFKRDLKDEQVNSRLRELIGCKI